MRAQDAVQTDERKKPTKDPKSEEELQKARVAIGKVLLNMKAAKRKIKTARSKVSLKNKKTTQYKKALRIISNSTNADLRLNIYKVLSSIEEPLIEKTFRTFHCTEINEESFYCLVYLARKGDKLALTTLNKNYLEYPVSTLQWAEVVRLFGQWNYKEATQNLLSTVDSASLNLANASIDSLLKMYPKAPSKFDGYEDAKNKLSQYLQEMDSNKKVVN